jgi:hypothetical protein
MAMRKAIAIFPALTMQLAAQQAGYRFPPNDTLKYHETTESRIELRPPRGVVTLTARHDAKIALATDRGDTVTAWYEELTLSSTSPQGDWRGSTSAALHLPFRLVLTRTGRVTTLSAPSFPPEIASHTDLTRQFEDFFISLPPSALRPSATWADTVETSTIDSPRETYQSRHIRRYRALRDTVLASGLAAMVIAFEQEITVRSSSPMKNAAVTIHTRLDGREEGTALFAPAAARLLSRVRRGHLDGEQVLKGEGREMTVPMVYDYSSSLDGLP